MVYVKKVNIKGQDYWYLFHTVRQDNKFLKKSKYLGKILPKNLEQVKQEFLNEVHNPKEKTENDKLIESLTPLERKVIPVLKEEQELNKIAEKSKLQPIEVLRALGWLEAKNLLKINKQEKEIITLDKNGLIYLKKGFPEKQFLKLLPASLEELRKHLNQDEVNVSIGSLKRKNAINFDKRITITNEGKKLLQEQSKEELFLKRLPIDISELDEKDIYNELKARKEIVKLESKKIITVELTNLGNALIKHKLKTNLIESLNQEMLLKKSWKNKTFRRFNIQSETPRIYPGRRHFVNEAINYIRKIWLELGFKEMTGNIVQTSFWNFDALFTAQDHPVRELQDTFFLQDPKYGSLPDELLEKVKRIHENGGDTGSKGWQYKFNVEEARKNILRTQTTVLSAKTISLLKKQDLPAKFFAVGRNYRNEALDWTHLFELTQVEGIVVDENANLRNLIGYLKEFFKKMGYNKIRVRPGFFPYTSNSTEIEVFHPTKKVWLELGGAGIFRPEVSIALMGKEIPVLAWGLGLDRTIMEYYNITDIRDLYKNDLKQIREMKLFLK